MLRGYSTDTRLQQKAKRAQRHVSPVPVGGRGIPPSSGNRPAGTRKVEPEDTCVVPREQRDSGTLHKGPLLPWGTDPRVPEKKRPSDPRPVARVASSPQLSRNGSQSARGSATGMSRRSGSGSDGRLERPNNPETDSTYKETSDVFNYFDQPTAGNAPHRKKSGALYVDLRPQREVEGMVSHHINPDNSDIAMGFRRGRGVRNGYEKFHSAAQSCIKDVLDSEKAATIANEQLAARTDPASTVVAGMTSTDLTRANRCEVRLGETVKVSRDKLTDPILHSIEDHGMLTSAEYGGAAGINSIRLTELAADYPLNPGVFAPPPRTDPLGHKAGYNDLAPPKKTGLKTFHNRQPLTQKGADYAKEVARQTKRESMQEQAAESSRMPKGERAASKRESTQARAAENRPGTPGTPGSMASLTSSRWR